MFEEWTAAERRAVALTLARLVVAGSLAYVILQNALLLSLVLLGVVVAADLADGMIARRWAGDTNRRRALDSIVDRISIHIVFLAFVTQHPSWLVAWGVLLARDLAAAAESWYSLDRKRALILGGRCHKWASISDALWGAALLAGSQYWSIAGAVLALVANYVLLLDYIAAAIVAPVRPRSDIVRRVTLERLAGIRAAMAQIGGAARSRSHLHQLT